MLMFHAPEAQALLAQLDRALAERQGRPLMPAVAKQLGHLEAHRDRIATLVHEHARVNA